MYYIGIFIDGLLLVVFDLLYDRIIGCLYVSMIYIYYWDIIYYVRIIIYCSVLIVLWYIMDVYYLLLSGLFMVYCIVYLLSCIY